jgi:hypothetical protein
LLFERNLIFLQQAWISRKFSGKDGIDNNPFEHQASAPYKSENLRSLAVVGGESSEITEKGGGGLFGWEWKISGESIRVLRGKLGYQVDENSH